MIPEDMAGKRVLVTAAAGGIGATIAARFAEAGARVFICDVDSSAVAEYLAAHPSIDRLQADVARQADVERFVAEGVARLGGLDVLVSNAGVAGPAAGIQWAASAPSSICACTRPMTRSSRATISSIWRCVSVAGGSMRKVLALNSVPPVSTPSPKRPVATA